MYFILKITRRITFHYLLFKEKEMIEYSQIKAELEELKTKEVAYKETLKKGDSILEKVNTDQVCKFGQYQIIILISIIKMIAI